MPSKFTGQPHRCLCAVVEANSPHTGDPAFFLHPWFSLVWVGASSATVELGGNIWKPLRRKKGEVALRRAEAGRSLHGVAESTQQPRGGPGITTAGLEVPDPDRESLARV